MKKLLLLSIGCLILSGCVAKGAPKKSTAIDDEPVEVTSSIMLEVTQEMIDRYYATHPKKTEQ